jgi:predicted transcriptional regulator
MTAARPFKARPTRADLERLYIEARYSIRETADLLGVSKDIVSAALREYGIPRRRRGVKRSRLADIPIELLEKGIQIDGLRGHARRLDVDMKTLYHHVKKRRSGGGNPI